MLAEEFSKATGLGFLVSQVFILIFLFLYYKEPTAVLYTVKMLNVTSKEVEVISDEYGMSVVYLLVSTAGCAFSFMCAQMSERGIIDNMTDFSEELLGSLGAWNAIHWIIVLFSHGLVAVLVCSPADLYMIVLSVFGIFVALKQMCSPGRRKSDSLALIVFMMLGGLIFNEMHSHHGMRMLSWTAVLMADVLLVIGHSYEAHVNIETIANCRVFYCSFVLVIVLILYAV